MHLHFLNVQDVSATCGQSTAASVVLPAVEHTSGAVALFSSHPRELRPKPDSVLLSEPVSVALHYRPLAAGCSRFLLNVVERATGRVADTVLVRAHAHAPQVTRMFEVDVPQGCAVHKKARAHACARLRGLALCGQSWQQWSCAGNILAPQDQLGPVCRSRTGTCTLSGAGSL